MSSRQKGRKKTQNIENRKVVYEKRIPHISEAIWSIIDNSRNLEFKNRCQQLLQVDDLNKVHEALSSKLFLVTLGNKYNADGLTLVQEQNGSQITKCTDTAFSDLADHLEYDVEENNSTVEHRHCQPGLVSEYRDQQEMMIDIQRNLTQPRLVPRHQKESVVDIIQGNLTQPRLLPRHPQEVMVDKGLIPQNQKGVVMDKRNTASFDNNFEGNHGVVGLQRSLTQPRLLPRDQYQVSNDTMVGLQRSLTQPRLLPQYRDPKEMMVDKGLVPQYAQERQEMVEKGLLPQYPKEMMVGNTQFTFDEDFEWQELQDEEYSLRNISGRNMSGYCDQRVPCYNETRNNHNINQTSMKSDFQETHYDDDHFATLGDLEC